MLLFVLLFCEGLMLMFFSQLTVLALAIPALMIFALFVQMSNGATYSIVTFINKNIIVLQTARLQLIDRCESSRERWRCHRCNF